MGKKGLFVRIDEEVLQRFKTFVVEKYGKLDGVFSNEVQQCITHWMAEQGLVTHANAHKINPGIPRVQLNINKVIDWLRGQGFTNQFTMQAWEQACMHTVGSDDRTVKNYLQKAKKLGRIKHYAGAVWEIV